MPGNIVTINNSKELQWYVGDSKMPEVIDCLNKVGIPEKEERNDQATMQHKNKKGQAPKAHTL